MTVPYIASIVKLSSGGTDQSGIVRSGEYTYYNPDNTLLDIQGAGFFADQSKFNFGEGDLMKVTASDGFAIMQFTNSDTVTVVLS